jgi:MFS family permease
MTSRTSARLQRMLPPTPLGRQLSLQSALYAVGSGVFLTGNAVFFTQVVGLSAAEVGVGMSISGVVAFAVSVPLGRVADRVGPRRTWILAAIGEAATYFGYPFVRGFAAYVAVVVALAVLMSLGGSGRGAYTIDALPPGDRVRTLAFVRSALNIGFTVGTLLGGIALGLGSRTVMQAVPAVAGVMLAVNAALVARLPDVRHVPKDDAAAPVIAPAALRNKGFLAVSLLQGLLGIHGELLNIVAPLWLVERTDAPHWVLAWLFGTNTVMAVLLQVPAARGSSTVAGAVRAGYLAAAALVTSCVVMMTTTWTHAWPTVVLLWLGYVAVTGAELYQSASAWGLSVELSEPARRAEYQGVWRLGRQLQSILGPAAFTWLAISWRPEGWLVIAGVGLLGAVFLRPAVAAAEAALRKTEAPQPG